MYLICIWPLMFHRQFFVYLSVIQLIVSMSYLEILRSVTEFILNVRNFLAFSICFNDGSRFDVHSCIKIYTFCQNIVLFFTKYMIIYRLCAYLQILNWDPAQKGDPKMYLNTTLLKGFAFRYFPCVLENLGC